MRDGRLLVGLDASALEALATAPAGSVRKAARPSLAIALAEGGWAATTVSATMIAASAAGITVFATGGIGGVHRGALDASGGAPASLDISSDLEELGRTAMAVVCAGPKAILDVPATLEYLETRGVPVIVVGQSEVPGFFARSSGIQAPASAPDVAGAARIVAAHLGLGLGSGALVCVPVPADMALPDDLARNAVARAIDDAEAAGIVGPAVTPWLLARIAELTDGRSVPANTALIVNNARTAGRLAAVLAADRAAAPIADGRDTSNGRTEKRNDGDVAAAIVRSVHSPSLGVTARASLRQGGVSRATEPPGPGGRRRMRIYEGSPRQDFEEVFRSIGAFLDQRGMKDVLLVEAPDGFIVQGLVLTTPSTSAWSDSMGTQIKETLTFLDDDIARFMEEAAARRGRSNPAPASDAGLLRDRVPRPRPLHG